MNIIIEVEDENIKSFIKQELAQFLGYIEASKISLNISEIIVTLDFEGKVNEIQGTKNYQAKHGVENSAVSGVAKIIERRESHNNCAFSHSLY